MAERRALRSKVKGGLRLSATRHMRAARKASRAWWRRGSESSEVRYSPNALSPVRMIRVAGSDLRGHGGELQDGTPLLLQVREGHHRERRRRK